MARIIAERTGKTFNPIVRLADSSPDFKPG
jgi:hypothetical protein